VYLPYLAQAVIEEPKITRYLLLNPSKAGFFLAFGFTVPRWDILRDALLSHVATHEVTRQAPAADGMKYVIEGALVTPDGRNPGVRAVWFIRAGETTPRFVSSDPLKKRRTP
jgi:hypothetical protein